MKLKIKKIKKSELLNLLTTKGFVYKNFVPTPDVTNINKALDKMFEDKESSKASVVCLDLYKYSQKNLQQQILIPGLMHDLHKFTIGNLFKYEGYIFENIMLRIEELENIDDLGKDIKYIDNGDGFFIIFPNPLYSLLYIIWFEISLRFYNTYHLSPEFREITGQLIIRYSISYDILVEFINDKNNGLNNFYGPALINAGRIISKDKLNRLLIDENVVNWFLRYFNGIENLLSLNVHDIINIIKSAYNINIEYPSGEYFSILDNLKEKHWGIRSIDLLKVGEIQIKNGTIQIHNLHIQAQSALLPNKSDEEEVKITVTIGNLNPIDL
ncbi:hypothetical protein CH372_19550 [Leptospira meyeri]|uniref:hypothetical protein n=1 Tax=Leptospira meyeri TaxID=29508 RepID=UPI000C2A0AF2|nr:hypothetical protein [Leptospira meyeri]PKA10407.1 hypothetical protein CH372_19550 [Leptospira meyeri]PKA22311.1 hypothetical protein CH381_31515 [Leptospira sp. mixed culture ATI2-C-A1]